MIDVDLVAQKSDASMPKLEKLWSGKYLSWELSSTREIEWPKAEEASQTFQKAGPYTQIYVHSPKSLCFYIPKVEEEKEKKVFNWYEVNKTFVLFSLNNIKVFLVIIWKDFVERCIMWFEENCQFSNFVPKTF